MCNSNKIFTESSTVKMVNGPRFSLMFKLIGIIEMSAKMQYNVKYS